MVNGKRRTVNGIFNPLNIHGLFLGWIQPRQSFHKLPFHFLIIARCEKVLSLMVFELLYFFKQPIQISFSSFCFKLAPPDCNCTPSILTKTFFYQSIALNIRLELINPKRRITFGDNRIFTTMLMPKTTVNKNSQCFLRKNYIWLTENFWVMKPVPEVFRGKEFSDH